MIYNSHHHFLSSCKDSASQTCAVYDSEAAELAVMLLTIVIRDFLRLQKCCKSPLTAINILAFADFFNSISGTSILM